MTARRAALLATIRGGVHPAPLLTIGEFAALLGVSLRTFYAYQRAGLFDRLRAPVPHRFSRAKVEAWLAGRPQGWVA